MWPEGPGDSELGFMTHGWAKAYHRFPSLASSAALPGSHRGSELRGGIRSNKSNESNSATQGTAGKGPGLRGWPVAPAWPSLQSCLPVWLILTCFSFIFLLSHLHVSTCHSLPTVYVLFAYGNVILK